MDYTTNGVVVTPQATVHVSYSASAETSAAIRRRIKKLLDEHCIPLDVEIEQFIQAIGEAATNAYLHGCRNVVDKKVILNAWLIDSTLTVEISDPGEGFDTSMPYRYDTEVSVHRVDFL
jgi:anti-sigma regulatory factor (Ser/Thr protein kinase)